jgi:aerobic-type carbon monoxide dehydrogenase small subunit (CoxS/CutS family)
MSTYRVEVTVNGVSQTLDVPVDGRLIDILRDDLGLTGTKEGCAVGACGLCSVIVDGALVSACLTPAVLTDGTAVETVEGLATPGGALARLQESFIEHGAFQCGICTPGQLMAATALLREHPHPTPEVARNWMSGTLCRCTGYEQILRAILAAARAGVSE